MLSSMFGNRAGIWLRTGVVAAAAVAAVAAAPAPASALTTYDTTYAWDGSFSTQPFGYDDTATYGQTFIAPTTDNVLQSFTFYLNDEGNGTTLQLQAQVYVWSGNLIAGNPPQGAVGAPLFTSAPITVGPTGGAFVPVTITTGGTALIPGGQYVALFTISGPDPTDYTNSTGTDAWGLATASHVAGNGGGGFNFYNNGGDYSLINNGDWQDYDLGDSAWTAVFTAGTAVPEPGTLSLLGAALLGFGVMRRRKPA